MKPTQQAVRNLSLSPDRSAATNTAESPPQPTSSSASPKPSTSPPTTYYWTTPRRPHHTPDEALGTRLATIAELNPDDLTLVTSFIDALVTKTRLKTLTGGAR